MVFCVLLFMLCLCVSFFYQVKPVFVCLGDSLCDVVGHVLCLCVLCVWYCLVCLRVCGCGVYGLRACFCAVCE